MHLEKGELGFLIQSAEDVLLRYGLELHLAQGFELFLFEFRHDLEPYSVGVVLMCKQ